MAWRDYNISIMSKPVENQLLRMISPKIIVQLFGYEEHNTCMCVNMSQLLPVLKKRVAWDAAWSSLC